MPDTSLDDIHEHDQPYDHTQKLGSPYRTSLPKHYIKSDKFHFVKNFNQSCLAQYLKKSVSKWLQDLRLMNENECLCVLQAKSLSNKNRLNNVNAKNIESKQSFKSQHDEKPTVANKNLNNASLNSNLNSIDVNFEIDIVELIVKQNGYINDEVLRLSRKIVKNSWQNIPVISRKLVNLVEETIEILNTNSTAFQNSTRNNLSACSSYILSSLLPNRINLKFISIYENYSNLKEIEGRLLVNTNAIRKSIQNMSGHQTSAIEKQVFQELLRKIDENFRKYFQKSIQYFTQVQLAKIYHRETIQAVDIILNQILEISLKSDQIKRVFIESHGILILFNTLRDPYFKNSLELILRTLSVLCSHLDSLQSLQQIDCFGTLADILCDELASEWTRTEAAGCIAQITSPSLDLCHNLTGFLENIQDLTRALTILCRDSTDIEIFLIGTAALANITFVDSITCEFFSQFSTAQVLIENFYLKNYNSIYVKDQITTILANMALLENCRVEIAEYNGLNLLIDFLMETPLSYKVNEKGDSKSSESELSACERVLQKAAIAISRFCREPKYSILLVELGVIPRLSTLCRNPNERNNSDSVLVACLAALRQMAATCDASQLLENDIQNLIKPSLKDSYVMCSSTEESYV